MNIDLAVVLCLAEEKKNQPFDEYCAGVVARMLEKLPEEKAFLSQYDIHYYIADNPAENSIARVVDADNNDDFKNGQHFAVVFNRDMLARLETEDSMAFVVGHELSHILYRKGFSKIRSLAFDEETACDCNAVRLMDAEGYNLLDIAAVDALYPNKTEAMKNRIAEREAFIRRHGVSLTEKLGKSRSLPREMFIHLQKEPWQRQNIFEHGEPDVLRIVEEMTDIFERGGRTAFKRGLRDFLYQKPTEESSKLIMNILGQVMPRFPSVTEVMTADNGKKFYNHPVVMMSDIVWEQFSRSGKKSFPPADACIVMRYMRDNSAYFDRRDRKFWEPMRQAMGQGVNMYSQKGGRI